MAWQSIYDASLDLWTMLILIHTFVLLCLSYVRHLLHRLHVLFSEKQITVNHGNASISVCDAIRNHGNASISVCVVSHGSFVKAREL